MSVQEQLVIIQGIDIGVKAYQKAGGFDKFENFEIQEKKNIKNSDPFYVGDVGIIYDGMSGEYCIVGIPIYVSEKFEPIGDPGRIEVGEIPQQVITKIIKFIMDNFGEEALSKGQYVKTLVFMHYT